MLVCSLIGNISVLDIFTFSLEHSPNSIKIFCSLEISTGDGWAKRTASSAYREHLSFAFAGSGNTGFRNPNRAAWSIIFFCSGSIAMINSSGNNGSPCIRPLACLIFWLGLPFIRILEDEDPRIEDIWLRHLVLNPKAASTSNKYCQPTQSNAFEMSNLIKRAGCFFLWSNWITLWTYRKLSWIHLLLINTFCACETNSSYAVVILLQGVL